MDAHLARIEAPPVDLMADCGRDELRLARLSDLDAFSADPAARAIAGWVRGFLMRPHPDLGRTGHVCPFTAQAARLSLLRIGVERADAEAAIGRTMREAMRAFDQMPCARSARLFRTVIVAFPQCAGPDGIAVLRRVQNAMRHHSVVRARMIGLFEPDSQAAGLINPSFRPLRSPVPALAIRMLVEQDAPFVLRNPLLLPIYLAKFPLAGARRLMQIATRAPGAATT